MEPILGCEETDAKEKREVECIVGVGGKLKVIKDILFSEYEGTDRCRCISRFCWMLFKKGVV